MAIVLPVWTSFNATAAPETGMSAESSTRPLTFFGMGAFFFAPVAKAGIAAINTTTHMKRAHGEPAHNLGTSEYAFAQVLIFKAASIPSSSRFLLIIRFGDREQLRRIRAHHLELGVALGTFEPLAFLEVFIHHDLRRAFRA